MANEVAAPPKRGGRGWIVWVLLALVAVGGGASLPWALGRHPGESATPKKKAEAPKTKQEVIPFENVVVNLGEDRLNRYLRVKIMVAVAEADVKDVTEQLTKRKAFLKNWLIVYLSDQSTFDVSRKVGLNRLRREIREQFNTELYPNGEELITDILFDEFHVQ
jgi:flagellar protein FliL